MDDTSQSPTAAPALPAGRRQPTNPPSRHRASVNLPTTTPTDDGRRAPRWLRSSRAASVRAWLLPLAVAMSPPPPQQAALASAPTRSAHTDAVSQRTAPL